MILVLGVCGFVRALLVNSATDVSCDRLVRSPDVAPLRGSIKEEEATETPHPNRSLQLALQIPLT
jgi:hypothetical protein